MVKVLLPKITEPIQISLVLAPCLGVFLTEFSDFSLGLTGILMKKQILSWVLGGSEGGDIAIVNLETFLEESQFADDAFAEEGQHVGATGELEARKEFLCECSTA